MNRLRQISCAAAIILLTLSWPSLEAAGTGSEAVPSAVLYEPLSNYPQIAQSIILAVAPTTLAVAIPRRWNADKTRWFASLVPDYHAAGPWTTTITIGSLGRPDLRLTLSEHGNGGTEAHWIDEKRMHLRCWFGRIIAVDLIVDAERAVVIDCEIANYHAFIGPVSP